MSAIMSSATASNVVACSPHSTFFGFMGVTSAILFANAGSAYGAARSGMAMSMSGVMRPDVVMKSIIPVVMAGILGIYGLILSIIIVQRMGDINSYSHSAGFAHLAAGLTTGLSSLAAGWAIGMVGDCGIRGVSQQPRLFVVMILILIFAEALALFGLIIGLSIAIVSTSNPCTPWSRP